MNTIKLYLCIFILGTFSMLGTMDINAETVTIGTSTSYYGYNIPFGTGGKYSTTETLYTPTEIGGPGKITAISYQVKTASALTTSSVRIYMGHYSSNTLSSSSYLPYSNMTLVYSGSPTLASSTGWNMFTLTSTFDYNGTDNLVVVVCKSASSTSPYQSFYYTYDYNSRCIYRQGSTSTYSSASSTSYFSNYYGRANTRFDISYNKMTLNGITYTYSSSSGEAKVLSGSSASGNVSIPSTISDSEGNSYTVTSIEASAFKNNTTITSVSLPSSITKIGDNAFYGCTGLTTINIPNSVTSLGTYAFYNCAGLTAISIPNTITSINNGVFDGCSGIKEITIPSSVTYIGSSAFYGCTGLTAITLPSSVTSISNYAFSGCTGLTDISIPSSVTRIWSSAFSGCKNITKVTFEKGNVELKIGSSLFSNVENISTINLGRTLKYDFTSSSYSSYPFYDSRASIKNVTISEGVEAIPEYLFYGVTGITNISLPESVTDVGNKAFTGCTGLTEPICNSSVFAYMPQNYSGSYTIVSTTKKISSGAFYGASSLTGITLPASVDSIANGLFYGCTSLTSINMSQGTKYIGTNAFYNCKALASIIIPCTVDSIGTGAFYGCTGMKAITFEDGADTLKIGQYETSYSYGMFYKCPLETVYLGRNLKFPNTTWSESPFSSGIKKIMVGSTVTTLPDKVFYKQTWLSELILSEGLKSIGADAFYECQSLTSVIIPNTVVSIGNYAFYDCSGLTSVSMPSALTTIGQWAFSNCSKLTSIAIPSSVTSVGDDAFGNCTGLNAVHITDLHSWCLITFTGGQSNPLEYAKHLYLNNKEVTDLVIPNTISSINNNAFHGCDGIKSVSIPSSVTIIGDDAFCGCGSLASITIPNSVTTICTYAFSGCQSLKNIEIPNSVTTLGAYAFQGCYSLESVKLSENANLNGYSIFSGCKSLKAITLPSSVTSIANYVFYGDSALTTVIVSENLKYIYGNAFGNCTSLHEFAIPASVTAIEAKSFDGCYFESSRFVNNSSLDAVANSYWGAKLYESKTSDGFYMLGDTLIGYTGSGGDIEIPEGIVVIGPNAFKNCSNITSVVFPATLSKIKEYAFYGCKGLTNVTIPVGIDSIPTYTFYKCTALETVKIPNTVKFIGQYAFYNTCLKNTVLPNSISSLYQTGGFGLCEDGTAHVPGSVTYVGRYTYQYYKNVVIEDGNNTVDFQDCNAPDGYWDSALNSAVNVYVGKNSFAEGSSYAGELFQNCLKTMTFGPNVTEVFKGDYYALRLAKSMTSVTCLSKEPFACPQFYTSTLSVHVPKGRAEAYKADSSWGKYTITEVDSVIVNHQNNVEVYTPDFDIDLSSVEGLKAYVINECSNGMAKLKEVKTIHQGEGVLLYGKTGTYSIPCTNLSTQMDKSNVLKGTISGKYVSEIDSTTTNYILSVAADGSPIFVKTDKYYGTQLLRNQAYVSLPTSSAVTDNIILSSEISDTDLSQYPNVLYIDGAEGNTGSSISLSLNMNNTIAPTGFQCDVYLPTGVEAAKDEDGFYLASLSTARTTEQKTNYFDSALLPDGSVRIMCSSTKNYTFSGNEGEVATLTVNIDGSMEDGEYPLILKNIVISDANSQTYEVDYVKTTLTVSSYTLGDANNDSKINVGDFTAIASDIMGNPPAAFVEKAADVNVDGKINVGDLTGVANLILYGTVTPPSSARNATVNAYQQTVLNVDDCQIVEGGEFTIGVNINGNYAFSGYQFDMSLPDGISVKMNDAEPCAWLSNARTNARRTDFFTSEVVGDNTLRVLSASSKGYTFEGTEGTVAFVTLVADKDIAEGDYIVGINNIVVSANGNIVTPDDTRFVVRVGSTTGIADITSTNDNKTVYDLSGKVVNTSSSLDGLHKGVYIMNGKKIVK